MARISVIIPAYNHASALPQTLLALFSQSCKDFEVVVIDDGSTDNTRQALIPWLERIKLIKMENAGASAARNLGAKNANGEYLLFMDADVCLRQDALDKFVRALDNNPKAAVAYSSFKFGWKTFIGGPWDTKELINKNYIHTTSLIRRSAFPGFDESLKRFQDWDLWLTIGGRGGKGVFIPEILFTIRPRKTGISKWLPSFAYRFPWLKAVKEYKRAEAIIRKKHNI